MVQSVACISRERERFKSEKWRKVAGCRFLYADGQLRALEVKKRIDCSTKTEEDSCVAIRCTETTNHAQRRWPYQKDNGTRQYHRGVCWSAWIVNTDCGIFIKNSFVCRINQSLYTCTSAWTYHPTFCILEGWLKGSYCIETHFHLYILFFLPLFSSRRTTFEFCHLPRTFLMFVS